MDDTRLAFTRRGYPDVDRKTCADCGTVYYSAGAHLERCPGLADEADALAARLSGLQDTLAEIRRVALDGDDGRICDALARCDAIDEIAALALNTDGPDGGAS